MYIYGTLVLILSKLTTFKYIKTNLIFNSFIKSWLFDIKDYSNTLKRDNNWSFNNKDIKDHIEKNEYIKSIRKNLIMKKKLGKNSLK